jgi:hypothetical protein
MPAVGLLAVALLAAGVRSTSTRRGGRR